MPKIKTPREFGEMSAAEKILYVQDLWDEIAATSNGDDLSLTDAQRQTLDERRDSHRADRSAGASWDEVQKRIRAKR